MPGYAALWGVIVNLVVALLVTWALHLFGVARGQDETSPGDYHADDAPSEAVAVVEPATDEAA